MTRDCMMMIVVISDSPTDYILAASKMKNHISKLDNKATCLDQGEVTPRCLVMSQGEGEINVGSGGSDVNGGRESHVDEQLADTMQHTIPGNNVNKDSIPETKDSPVDKENTNLGHVDLSRVMGDTKCGCYRNMNFGDMDSIRTRHENGHLLLGNSVSYYIDDTSNGTISLPTSNSSALEHKLCPSCYPNQSDSGICSETTSAIEPINQIKDQHSTVTLDDALRHAHHAPKESVCFDIAHLQALYPDILLNSYEIQTPTCKPDSVCSFEISSVHPNVNVLPCVDDTPEAATRDQNNELQADQPHPLQADQPHPSQADQPHPLQADQPHPLQADQPHPLQADQPHPYAKRNSCSDRHHYSNIYQLVTSKFHPSSKKQKIEKKEDQSVKEDPDKLKPPKETFCTKYTSCRWVLAYMCFLARFVQTALRQCMGIAVVGMTLKTTTQVAVHNLTQDTFAANGVGNSSPEINRTITQQEFVWSSVFEGVLLASFNVGAIITPIIVGYLTTRHGGRSLMTSCLVCAGVFTGLLPLVAKLHPSLIIVSRIITGIALSGTDSLVQGMWAKWAPRYEMASLASCSYTGLSVAGVLTFLVCGYLVSIGGDGKGWPYIFYLFGALCLLLAPIWWYTVYDAPDSHPRITKHELAIITFNKRPQAFDDNQPLNTPWRRILKSPAVWVILMGHISNKWILSFMLSYLPRYFNDFFQFDLKTDGLLSSLPFAGRILTGLITGYLSDWMLRRGVSVCRTRKSFQSIGCFGCAVYCLFIAFIPGLTSAMSISLLVLALSFQNITSVAFRINLLDIAPRYAGLLNGVVSTIATLISLPAPVVTSLLISGGSRHGWMVVFCLVAAFNIVGGLIYVMFARGEIQEWATSEFVYEVHATDEETIDGRAPQDTSVASGLPGASVGSVQAPSTSEQDIVSASKVKVLREVKSVPLSTRRGSRRPKERLGRRATMDVGSLIKRVQSQAFSNLAFADL